MDDASIRQVVVRGMSRRPGLVRVLRLRNAAILGGMVLGAGLLARFSTLDLGLIFGLVGGLASILILGWNVVWVNTVLYRLSRDEVERGLA